MIPTWISISKEWNVPYCDLLVMSGMFHTVNSFSDEWNDPYCELF